MKKNPDIRKRNFFSKRNYDSFISKLHPNRIVDQLILKDHNNRTLYQVQYYIDTKRTRKKYNFLQGDY